MDKRKREQRKAAKKAARRKAYIKHRNRMRYHKVNKLLEKNKVKPVPESEKIDGAEWYRRYKEQERLNQPIQQKKSSFWGHVQKVLSGNKKGS
jgi:hypothetical protein